MPGSILHASADGPGLRFRLWGIPVRVEWIALLWPAAIGLTFGNLWVTLGCVVVFVGSVLIHELGHAAAFRRWGVQPSIVLHVMGGVTMGEGVIDKRSRRIAISLAGPVAEIVLFGLPGLVLLSVTDVAEPWDALLAWAVVINLVWAGVNLLPMLPLDGGLITSELIDAVRPGQGVRLTRILSVGVAAAGAVVAWWMGLLIVGFFALFLGWENVTALRRTDKDDLSGQVAAAHAALEAGDPADALARVAPIVGDLRDPDMRSVAVEIGAWAALAVGDLVSAGNIASHQPPGTPMNGHLRALLVETDPAERVNADVDAWLSYSHVGEGYVEWMEQTGLLEAVADRVVASRADSAVSAAFHVQSQLFHSDRFDLSARVGEGLLRSGRMPAGPERGMIAFNVACAHDRAGRVAAALSWLEVAVSDGYADLAAYDDDPDIAGARSDPRFAPIRERLASAGPWPPVRPDLV